MFRSLINDAKAAAGAVIAKYVVRASVAVPFVIAAAFGTAALTLVLIESVGAATAYTIMAVGFAVVGLVSAAVVSVKEHEETVADAAAEKNDTAEVATDAAAQAAVQVPLALLGALLTSPMAPGTALGGLKMIGRNLPLVVLLAIIGLLFWPTEEGQAGDGELSENSDDSEVSETDAGQWHPPSDMDRRAA